MTTYSDQIGQIYLGEEELKVRRIGHVTMMEQDAVHIGYEADIQRKENRSHRATGHRSGSECDADKNLGKNGIHEGRSNSNESPTGRRKNTNNGSPHGRKGSLDELPGAKKIWMTPTNSSWAEISSGILT